MDSNILKYLVFPSILVLVSVGAIFWVLWPLYGDISGALILKSQLQANLDERVKLSDNLKRLMGQYKEQSESIALIEKAAPVGKNIPDLLVNLEAIASETGMKFGSVDFKEADSKISGIKTVAMNVSVKGTYESFKNYLESLESSIRIFDVMSASFGGFGDSGSASSKITDFSLIINTYFQ